MKQILIKFDESISDEEALDYVKDVIQRGKISDNNKRYCYATTFNDKVMIYVSERTKYPTFRICDYIIR